MRVCTRSLASRFDSGSSIRNTCGWRTIARPIATRWRWPPDSLAGLRSRNSSRSRSAAASLDPLGPLGLRHPLDLEVEADVLADGHVRVERVGLEHHGDVAVLRRHVGDVTVADADRAVVDRFEPGEHPQRRRLAAARRSDEDEELAVVDVQIEVVDSRVVETG